jgi:hypothetical protein
MQTFVAKALESVVASSEWQNHWRRQLKFGGDKWCSEFSNNQRPISTTWPWSIRPSLAVLWGVCWMFYPSGEEAYDDWSGSGWQNWQSAPQGEDASRSGQFRHDFGVVASSAAYSQAEAVAGAEEFWRSSTAAGRSSLPVSAESHDARAQACQAPRGRQNSEIWQTPVAHFLPQSHFSPSHIRKPPARRLATPGITTRHLHPNPITVPSPVWHSSFQGESPLQR